MDVCGNMWQILYFAGRTMRFFITGGMIINVMEVDREQYADGTFFK